MRRILLSSGIKFSRTMKLSLAVVVLGALGILAIMQWTAYSVRRHVGIASLCVFPAALDSQRAGTAFERMNRDYSDAFVMQDKASLASAGQEAATVIASLESAGRFMAFNSIRHGQVLSLLQRVTSLQARSKIDYAAGAENDGTPPSQQELADLSRENKAVVAALETLQNDLASDFKGELAVIDTLLTVEGILQALVFVGVIAALFFGIRSLIKVTVQRREDEILHEAHAMQESERNMLRALIDNIPEFIYVKDAESRFVVANPHVARMMGAETPEQLLGKTDFDFYPGEMAGGFYEDEQNVIRSGKPLYNYEEKCVDGAGNEIHILTSKVPLRNSEGRVVGIAGVGRDISARKKMEDALREAEQKYRGLFDKAIVGIFQSTPEGRFLSVNRSMAFTFGYDSPEEMAASITDISRQLFVDAKRGVEFMLVMDRVGGVRNFECEARCKDGGKIWLSMNIRAIRENGAVIRYEGMCEDISARKKMEDALREAEQKYRGIFDNAIVGIFQTTPEGRLLSLNPAMATIFGYDSPDEALQCVSDIARQIYVDPDRREEMQRLMEARGVVQSFECEVFHKDGGRIWLSIGARAVKENGAVVRWEGMCEDISARKKMEDALREAEQKYRGIFDNAIFGIFQTTPDGRLLSANPAMALTYGYESVEEGMASASSCDISGRVYVDPERRREFKRLMEGNGAVQNFEYEAYRRDGSKIWLSMSARAICENGTVVRYEGMSEDITERKLLREQLLQAQKLESVGQLAAGIAHEINTPTQYIGDNVRFLKDAFQDLKNLLTNYDRLLPAAKDNTLSREMLEEVAAAMERADSGYLLEEIPKAIEQTLEGVSRVSGLVSAMKEFSHPDTKEKSPLDLNRAIAGTITVARNEWKYVADMETDFDTSLPAVSCHPGEFNQVILNLIVNAAHAIGDVARQGGAAKRNDQRGDAEMRGVGRDPHPGHGHGNPGKTSHAHLRSVLHDQGDRQGNRTGAGHCAFGGSGQTRRESSL